MSRGRRSAPRISGGNGPIIAVLVSTLLFILAIVYVSYSRSPRPTGDGFSRADRLPPGGDVRIPLAALGDGRAHFYRYVTRGGREIRVFLVRTPDGVVFAAFDACDDCYRKRKGFHQEGNDMVCNSCSRRVRTSEVNAIGAVCGPSALPHTTEGREVVLAADDLDRGARYF